MGVGSWFRRRDHPALAAGLAAGAVRAFENESPLTREAAPVLLFGGVLWMVALVHVDRLFAFARGTRTARSALAAVGIAVTVVALAMKPSLGGAVFVVAWCVAQLAALWYARADRYSPTAV